MKNPLKYLFKKKNQKEIQADKPIQTRIDLARPYGITFVYSGQDQIFQIRIPHAGSSQLTESPEWEKIGKMVYKILEKENVGELYRIHRDEEELGMR